MESWLLGTESAASLMRLWRAIRSSGTLSPLVRGWSWVSCLNRAHSSVSAVRELVERSGHRRGPTVITRDPRLEPEFAGVGQVEVNVLSHPWTTYRAH